MQKAEAVASGQPPRPSRVAASAAASLAQPQRGVMPQSSSPTYSTSSLETSTRSLASTQARELGWISAFA